MNLNNSFNNDYIKNANKNYNIFIPDNFDNLYLNDSISSGENYGKLNKLTDEGNKITFNDIKNEDNINPQIKNFDDIHIFYEKPKNKFEENINNDEFEIKSFVDTINKFDNFTTFNNYFDIIDDFNIKFNNIDEQNFNKQNININKLFNTNGEKKKKNIFLTKKRKIFKVIYRNNFSIFTLGEYHNDSRKLIEETLKEIKNDKNKIESKEEAYNPKILHKKKRHNIMRRKYNSDNITKKIKSRYLKSLKLKTNEILKSAGSKKLFKSFPQEFVCNLSKSKNKNILDMTYKELILKNFIGYENYQKSSLSNYKHNKSVLEYLEKNKDIKLNLNFFNMTYSQIFNEYLGSKEFEMEIDNLRKQKENIKYIKKYIIKAHNFIKFFS